LLLTTVLRPYNDDKCDSPLLRTKKVEFVKKLLQTNALPEYFDVDTPFYGRLIGTNNYRINTRQYLIEIIKTFKKTR